MERRYSRRALLGLSAAAILEACSKEPKAKTRTLPVAAHPLLFRQDTEKATTPTSIVIPMLASGDEIVLPPPPPEIKKQTPFIEAKPVWSQELMAADPQPLKRINTTAPLIAITIDDGFAKNSLRKILSVAVEKGITYTDFMKGTQREMYPDFVQEMINSQRVEFGSHTQTHRDERNSPQPGRPPTREELIEDIYAPERFLQQFGATCLPYQRPPGGAYSPWTIEVAAGIGFRSINWAASADYGTTTPVSTLKPGDIVLMHYRDESAAQFAGWIDAVRSRGLEPTTLSNVFAAEER